MNVKNVLIYNLEQLAKCFQISSERVTKLFQNPRGCRASVFLRTINEMGMRQSRKGEYSIARDRSGRKWKFLCLTRDGVQFVPMPIRGRQRMCCAGYAEKSLSNFSGYIVADLFSFPNVPYWVIPTELVRLWHQEELLGAQLKFSRNKALRLLEVA
jgi:hypothetical protein